MQSHLAKTTQALVVVLLAVAGFAGLRSLAQTLPAGIPAAPPGGINASKLPDTNGVHLGMTQDEALAVMKGLYPGNFLEIKRDKFDNGQEWITVLHGASVETCNNACGDEMYVDFNQPPNPPLVVGIARSMRMAPGKQPTMETTVASLRQKYGKEVVTRGDSMAWVYDEQGQPINPQGPSNWSPVDCAGGIDSIGPLSISVADMMASMNRNLCSRNVYVRANLGPQSIQGTPVVLSVDLVLGEKSLGFRDMIATRQYFADKQQQQQQQQMKSAQQQKAPTL